jgi:ribonuclease R
MEQEGLIIKNRKNRYGVPARMDLVVGRLQGHAKGFGFLISDEHDQDDVYISIEDINGAMHNDRVVGRLIGEKKGKSTAGEIIKVLERANHRVVGEYEDSNNFGFVVPDDSKISQDVFVPKSQSKGAKAGEKVVAEIDRWPAKRRNPEGKIVEILGHKSESGVDIETIIKKLDLPDGFPEDVKQQVADIPDEISAADRKGRKDLRDVKMVTIDGETAKDFDDAVSIEKLGDGKARLGVHIADVTHYVKEGSPLDKEAVNRATSIYLVDRVIPMLPEKLSNNLCSLKSNQDRLAMSVLMKFDLETGEVIDHEITESVIEVDQRLTYNQVKKMLVDEDQELIDKYDNLITELRLMADLSKKVRKLRQDKGSIDFEFPEAEIILDEQGAAVDIVKVDRTIAEKLIEDFMIRTNEIVAEEMYHREVPFIYRVHEEPATDEIEELNSFLHNLGYHVEGLEGDIHPMSLKKVLDKVAGEPEERVVNTVLLRTMQKAHYHPDNIGHFGLASRCYSHFTSPIRRYPDLMIHRIIKEVINNGILAEERREELEDELYTLADHCSIQERKAMDAERESKDLKKVEFMKDQIGEEYEGVISGVMSFGFFVELDNTIEGLVHVSTLVDDYYHYHEDKQAIIGERTAKIYRLGDEVEVEVSKVNVDEQQVDFELID